VSRKNENESESYEAAAYIGILFFLWDMPCGLGFWLMESFLEIHFLISQTLIGKFVMESAPPTVQVLVLLLPISKVGWELLPCLFSFLSWSKFE